MLNQIARSQIPVGAPRFGVQELKAKVLFPSSPSRSRNPRLEDGFPPSFYWIHDGCQDDRVSEPGSVPVTLVKVRCYESVLERAMSERFAGRGPRRVHVQYNKDSEG
jgi:hypothetical protein